MHLIKTKNTLLPKKSTGLRQKRNFKNKMNVSVHTMKKDAQKPTYALQTYGEISDVDNVMQS